MSLRATVVLAALVLVGCGKTAVREGNPMEGQARSALAAISAEFTGGRAEDFFAHFDRRDFPHYEAFRDRAREFLLRNRQVTMDIIVDTILTEGGEVAVSARWNRSFVDAQGAHKLQQGRCEFVFRKRPSGGLALLAIHGDSPF